MKKTIIASLIVTIGANALYLTLMLLAFSIIFNITIDINIFAIILISFVSISQIEEYENISSMLRIILMIMLLQLFKNTMIVNLFIIVVLELNKFQYFFNLEKGNKKKFKDFRISKDGLSLIEMEKRPN